MKILVVATPKTGNHWLRSLLAELYDLKVVPVADLVSTENGISHEHFTPDSRRREWLENNGITPVTIFRHPADTLVSLYHYVWMRTEILPEEESILSDRDGIGAGTLEYAAKYFYPLLMVSELWRLAGAPYVRYEDLMADPVRSLRRLTSEIAPVSHDVIRQAIVLSQFSLKRDTFDSSKGDYKAGKNFYRRGGTGYQDELTPEIMALLSTGPFREYMEDLGYDLQMDPVTRFDIGSLDPFQGHHTFTNGVHISPKLYRLILKTPNLASWEAPWEVAGEDSFYDWLNAPEHPGAPLTNLMRLVYTSRSDLREKHPAVDVTPREFQTWFIMFASKEYDLGPEFLAPARRLLIASGEHVAPDELSLPTATDSDDLDEPVAASAGDARVA